MRILRENIFNVVKKTYEKVNPDKKYTLLTNVGERSESVANGSITRTYSTKSLVLVEKDDNGTNLILSSDYDLDYKEEYSLVDVYLGESKLDNEYFDYDTFKEFISSNIHNCKILPKLYDIISFQYSFTGDLNQNDIDDIANFLSSYYLKLKRLDTETPYIRIIRKRS